MSDNKTTLFVHGFSPEMDKQARIDFILEKFGEYDESLTEANIKIIENREYGGLKNFCFVDLDFAGAKKAMTSDLNGYKLDDGGEISLSIAKPREPRDNSGYKGGGGGRSNNW
jgi:hypothetical protein